MSSITEIPLFGALRDAQSVLLAGCGGGFDIYAGVPIALALRRLGKSVTLANLTFASPRSAIGAEALGESLTRIDATMGNVMDYFPEWYLACWLRKHHHSTSRTRGSELFINPLMGIYWCYQASAVIDRILYKDAVRPTQTFRQLLTSIEAVRKTDEGRRARVAIPG